MRGGVEYDQGPAWQEMLDLFEEIAQTKQELADQSKRASPLRLFKRYRKQYLDIGSRGMKKQEKIFWPA